MKLFPLLVLTLSISACSPGSVGNGFDSSTIKIKNNPKVVFYPERTSVVLNHAGPMLYLNNQPICKLVQNSFMVAEAKKGKNKIFIDYNLSAYPNETSLLLENKKTYYVKIVPSSDAQAGARLGAFGLLGGLIAAGTADKSQNEFELLLRDQDTAERELRGYKESTTCDTHKY